MQNAPLISFYQGLLQAKLNTNEGLNSRKTLAKAKVEHLKNDHFIVSKEMQDQNIESL